MHAPLARLLELRLRYRRNPAARAYVDRALGLVSKALSEDADLAIVDAEMKQLAADLAARFGARTAVKVH
jgi:hypothetical protein